MGLGIWGVGRVSLGLGICGVGRVTASSSSTQLVREELSTAVAVDRLGPAEAVTEGWDPAEARLEPVWGVGRVSLALPRPSTSNFIL